MKNHHFLNSITFQFSEISKFGCISENLLFKKVSNPQNSRKFVILFPYSKHTNLEFLKYEKYLNIRQFESIYFIRNTLVYWKIPKFCKFTQFFIFSKQQFNTHYYHLARERRWNSVRSFAYIRLRLISTAHYRTQPLTCETCAHALQFIRKF